MDRLGITTQAVSATPFLLYPDAPPDVAPGGRAGEQRFPCRRPLAAILNRFAPLASVPLQDPERAAAELERAVGLGLHGVEIPPSTPDLAFDDPRLEPFWAAAEARRVPLCIHPFEASPRGAFARYLLSPLVGNLYDTGLAADSPRHGRRARASSVARSSSTTAAARSPCCSRASTRDTSSSTPAVHVRRGVRPNTPGSSPSTPSPSIRDGSTSARRFGADPSCWQRLSAAARSAGSGR